MTKEEFNKEVERELAWLRAETQRRAEEREFWANLEEQMEECNANTK